MQKIIKEIVDESVGCWEKILRTNGLEFNTDLFRLEAGAMLEDITRTAIFLAAEVPADDIQRLGRILDDIKKIRSR